MRSTLLIAARRMALAVALAAPLAALVDLGIAGEARALPGASASLDTGWPGPDLGAPGGAVVRPIVVDVAAGGAREALLLGPAEPPDATSAVEVPGLLCAPRSEPGSPVSFAVATLVLIWTTRRTRGTPGAEKG